MNENKKMQKGRKRITDIRFSLVGSFVIILFFALVNFTAGGNFPWFIFPSYAVLWWPVGLIFGRKSGKILSLAGSLFTIAFFAVVNYVTSWNFPWFLFPSFAILWWPISVFWGTKDRKIFSLIGSGSVILFSAAANLVTTPSVLWFHYITFAVLWWPLSAFLSCDKTIRAYSVIGGILLLAFVTFESFIRPPSSSWALLTYFPIMMWPVSAFLGKKLGKLTIALLFSLTGIVYYLILNLYIFKGFPWVIYPAYSLLWWPLAVGSPRKNKALFFAVTGFLLTAGLFIVTNYITSPNIIWAVYPVFAISWWPLAVYYFIYRRRRILPLS